MFIKPRCGKTYTDYYLILYEVLINERDISISYVNKITREYLIKIFVQLAEDISTDLVKTIEEDKIIFKNNHYILFKRGK